MCVVGGVSLYTCVCVANCLWLVQVDAMLELVPDAKIHHIGTLACAIRGTVGYLTPWIGMCVCRHVPRQAVSGTHCVLRTPATKG